MIKIDYQKIYGIVLQSCLFEYLKIYKIVRQSD